MNKGILNKILNKLPSEGFQSNQFSLGRNMICTMFTLYPLVVFCPAYKQQECYDIMIQCVCC